MASVGSISAEGVHVVVPDPDIVVHVVPTACAKQGCVRAAYRACSRMLGTVKVQWWGHRTCALCLAGVDLMAMRLWPP